jgi:hypothetical protein
MFGHSVLFGVTIPLSWNRRMIRGTRDGNAATTDAQRLIRMTFQEPQLPARSRARTRTSRSYAFDHVTVLRVAVVIGQECHAPPTRRRWTW